MTEDKIKNSLTKVKEPFLNTDYISLDFVKNISLNGNNLNLTIGISDMKADILSGARDDITNILKQDFPELKIINIDFKFGIVDHNNEKKKSILPMVKNTIAIASGKGGVGKSTVAVNLAVAMAKEGLKVGLIDADIYGPSIPLMFGVKFRPKVVSVGDKNKLVPIEKFGVKLMSIGFLMETDTAVVWRGPMASSALKQFMEDVEWGDLDFLLFDMPPGTGDIQLTLSQTVPLTGAIIVTTPQDISLADAIKGYQMFKRVNVSTLGIIENMSYYNNPDGSREYIFGKGGGKKMSDDYNVKLLGEIPINTVIRKGGDEGIPVTENNADKEISGIFTGIAHEIIRQVNIKNIKTKSESDLVIEI